VKVEPETLQLVKLWNEERARRCEHDFKLTEGEVYEDENPEPLPIYECRKCGQLRKPKR
jgi:hypothetical protein